MKNNTFFQAILSYNGLSYREVESTWYYTTLGLLSLSVLCLVAGTLDERVFNGVSVWSKPGKFAFSLAVFFGTLLIFASYLPRGYLHRGVGRFIVLSLVCVALAEQAYITFQAALGQASHFNFSTPLHGLIYSMMGVGALWLVTAPLWLAVIIGKSNSKNDPLILSIIIGLVLAFVLGGGFGSYLGSQTSHWVNAAQTDVNGLWFFGWARDGGDLRVPHFFGLHAMQAVPLCAVFLPKRLDNIYACALVVLFSAIYAAGCIFTFFQAVGGRPFIG